MIKKIGIFSVLILFCVSVSAQNKMGKDDFEHLVDYANCQYLMRFIEKHDAGKDYLKDTYEKRIKPVLQEATLDKLKSVPDYSIIKSLFPTGSNDTALKLAEEINKRKGKYDEHSVNKSLIESLITTEWNKEDLSRVANTIQKDIRKIFKDKQSQKPTSVAKEESVIDQTTQIPSQVEELKASINDLQQQYNTLQNDSKIGIMQGTISTLRLLVIICMVVVVLLITALFLWYKMQFNTENRNSSVRKFVKTVFFTSEEIREMIEPKPKVIDVIGGNNDISDLKSKINLLQSRLDELSEKVKPTNTEKVKNSGNQKALQQINNLPQQPNNPLQSEKDLYFASKSNKQLIEQLSNSANASFKVIKIKGNEAEFEYVGAVRNENWFEGVCIIENLANDILSDKKYITTTQPGKVIKDNDNWVVITPAKIKFV